MRHTALIKCLIGEEEIIEVLIHSAWPNNIHSNHANTTFGTCIGQYFCQLPPAYAVVVA